MKQIPAIFDENRVKPKFQTVGCWTTEELYVVLGSTNSMNRVESVGVWRTSNRQVSLQLVLAEAETLLLLLCSKFSLCESKNVHSSVDVLSCPRPRSPQMRTGKPLASCVGENKSKWRPFSSSLVFFFWNLVSCHVASSYCSHLLRYPSSLSCCL